MFRKQGKPDPMTAQNDNLAIDIDDASEIPFKPSPLTMLLGGKEPQQCAQSSPTTHKESNCHDPTSRNTESVLVPLTKEGNVPHLSNQEIFKKLLPPTIIVAYMSLWIGYYMLTHASSRSENAMDDLNPAVLVFAVEMAKLFVAMLIFIAQESLSELWNFLRSGESFALLKQYFPIAALYGLYNNLMIINVRAVDPTTFLVISSSRLIMTAFLWQWVFGKRIPPSRKVALFMITLGVILKGFNGNSGGDADTNTHFLAYLFRVGLIVFQMSCSVMASVYNEKSLKGEHHPQLQNMALYINSIAFSLMLTMLNINGTDKKLNLLKSLRLLSSGFPLWIVLCLTAVGIVTAFLLRYVDSVAKAVASSSEAIFTTILGRIFFGHQITSNVVISVALVSAGASLYAMQSKDLDSLSFANSLATLGRTQRSFKTLAIAVLLVLVLLNVARMESMIGMMMRAIHF